MQFSVISADSHVDEPRDLWERYLPTSMRSKAPRVVRCEDGGDGWSFDGKPPARSFGLGTQTGKPFQEYRSAGGRYDEMRPGQHDGRAHLEDQKYDGVDGSVIYPGVAATCFVIEDRELGVACIRAYNDWVLKEFCAADPRRLVGMGLLPLNDGIEVVLDELRRCLSMGFKAFVLPGKPDRRYHDPYYDPMWKMGVEGGVTFAFHRTFGRRNAVQGVFGPQTQFIAGNTWGFFTPILPLSNLIFSGVFDRFPELKMVTAETNFGWMPVWIELMEQEFNRHRHWTKSTLKLRPKEYVWNNVYGTFLEDNIGFDLIDRVPVDNVMFSNDYPHGAGLWPDSQKYIASMTRRLSPEVRHKVVAGNAARLYRMG